MKFVQIIEMTLDKFDEIEVLHEKWMAATVGQRTTRLQRVLRDREDPSRFVVVVLFDSFEDAMKNNDLPATSEIAGVMNDLTTAQTVFRNLDLIRVDAE